jgi:hypothetical protein
MSAPPKPEFRVVLVAVGRTITNDAAHSKSKIALLEDRKLVLIYADGNRAARRVYDLLDDPIVASFNGENAIFRTTEGDVRFNKASCNCGMGVVAYAGITEDGREILTSVRPPDWVSGL